MRLAHSRFVLLALALATTSCSDPKSPSETNFRKAIDAYYATHPRCTMGLMGNAKVGQAVTLPPGSYDPTYVDLQAAGAVKIEEVPAPKSPNYQNQGPWHVVTILNEGIWKSGWGFCYGNYSISKIVQWSPPAAMDGLTVSQVKYQWKFIPAKWASEAFLKAHYAQLQGEDSATLVLMNDGWQIPDGERLF